jgi:uncharacterized SAM-binding protein YcdF (DUF218 family)
MEWLFTNLLAAALLPPLNLILLGTVGLSLLRRHPRLGKALLVATMGLLYLLSAPFVADRMLAWLERDYPYRPPQAQAAQAVVVLAAGKYRDAPEYAGDTLNRLALERARYAARLHRITGKPILVSGGNPGGGLPEALAMKEALERDFRVQVRWVETRSINTYENARLSRDILARAGIRKIYLVTHAWHLPRAAAAFRHAGFEVVPAGTVFTTAGETGLMDYLPQAKGLRNAYLAMHEAVGLVWYELRFALGEG